MFSPLLLHVSTVHFFVLLNSVLLSEFNSLFIHSPIDGHLGSFLFEATVSEIALNIFVSVACVFLPLEQMLRSGLADS